MQSPSIPVTDPASLLAYAKQLGYIPGSTVISAVNWRAESQFLTQVMKLGRAEDKEREEAHKEEVSERKLGVMLGELDVGQDDYSDVSSVNLTPAASRAESVVGVDRAGGIGKTSGVKSVGSSQFRGDCLAVLCKSLGRSIAPGTTVVTAIPKDIREFLKSALNVHIGCFVYGSDDPRNHVMLVHKTGKSGTLRFQSLDPKHDPSDVTCVLTTPMEFFNENNRFSETAFYASAGGVDDQGSTVAATALEDMSDFRPDIGFGGDVRSGSSRAPAENASVYGGVAGRPTAAHSRGVSGVGQGYAPRPPASVIDESEHAGSNNTTRGVVRAKRRVVKGISTADDAFRVRRNYQVTGVTMFNNLDEIYLDVISKDYAQEIIEKLFAVWQLPTDQPEAMQYAEDLLHGFIIARTASNKADYNAEFEVPTREGEVTVSFARLSLLLSDTYGITRRNFARAIADDLRSYINRPENQVVKARSAQRVGADPQYGDLCFDGSTKCTGLTSSEMTFCSLLEGRNLYERDDVIAQGASEKLMQGIHGGVRSVVQR